MSSGQVLEVPAHPLERLARELDEALGKAVGAPAWTLTPNQLTALLPMLEKARRQLDAQVLAVLVEADRHQVGDSRGFANTGAWWAEQTRTPRPAAFKDVKLATALDAEEHAPVADALARGEVSAEQAHVIVTAIDALPAATVDAELRGTATDTLIELAEHHDTRELRILGRKILDVVAPEIGEAHEARLLEDEERAAWESAYLRARSDGAGSIYGSFKLPDQAWAMLHKHLAALAAPKHRHATKDRTQPDPSKPSERVARQLSLGQAFITYIETHARTGGSKGKGGRGRGEPKAGGMPATVVVTLDHDTLIGACQKAGLLDTGEMISPAAARRIACGAGIIPAVLGTISQPLDLGRKTRFHTESQRIAMALRDKGCSAAGCDWPPGMCQAHHMTLWSHGGQTTVADGRLFCPRHHRMIHDSNYQFHLDKHGNVVFTRRT